MFRASGGPAVPGPSGLRPSAPGPSVRPRPPAQPSRRATEDPPTPQIRRVYSQMRPVSPDDPFALPTRYNRRRLFEPQPPVSDTDRNLITECYPPICTPFKLPKSIKIIYVLSVYFFRLTRCT